MSTPRLDQLHSAFLQADAAGDAATAQVLADAIRAEEAGGGELVQMGPGMGRSVPDPTQQANELDALRREVAPHPMTDFVSGNIAGAAGTGLGIAQTGAHINLPAQAANFVLKQAGMEGGPVDTADALVRDFREGVANDPGLQSGAGQAGQLTGAMLSTAPLAAAAVPAKGAGALEWLGKGALGGALAETSQPVDPANFWGEKGKQAAMGTAIGAGVPLLARGGMKAAEHLWGPNVLAQMSNVPGYFANQKPFTAESEALAKRTGVELTPAQISGGKMQTALENMSRQSVFSADKAFEADTKIAGQAVAYIDRVMNNISKNPAGEVAIGHDISAVSRGAVQRLADRREFHAARQYGQIDDVTHGMKFVRPTAAMREADAIIAEFGAIDTPEAARIVSQAQTLRDKMATREGYTFGEAQRSRSYYGKGARGSTNIFDEVNPDINRQIATRLFKAFDADMQNSAKGLAASGRTDLATAINRANATYKKYSQAIDAVESHPIGRLFGDQIKVTDVMEFNKLPPETVINRITSMQPSEIKMVRDFMQRNAPDTWQQYKRLLVEKSLAEAQTLPTTAGANHVPFNAAAFVRALGGNKPEKIKQLNQIFSANEMKELDDAFGVARRLGDRFGYNASGTGPYNEVQGFLHSLKQSTISGLASAAGAPLGLRKIANVMLASDGRRALVQLSRLPPASKQATALAGYIMALANGQSSQRSNNPQRGMPQAVH